MSKRHSIKYMSTLHFHTWRPPPPPPLRAALPWRRWASPPGSSAGWRCCWTTAAGRAAPALCSAGSPPGWAPPGGGAERRLRPRSRRRHLRGHLLAVHGPAQAHAQPAGRQLCGGKRPCVHRLFSSFFSHRLFWKNARRIRGSEPYRRLWALQGRPPEGHGRFEHSQFLSVLKITTTK